MTTFLCQGPHSTLASPPPRESPSGIPNALSPEKHPSATAMCGRNTVASVPLPVCQGFCKPGWVLNIGFSGMSYQRAKQGSWKVICGTRLPPQTGDTGLPMFMPPQTLKDHRSFSTRVSATQTPALPAFRGHVLWEHSSRFQLRSQHFALERQCRFFRRA